MIIFNFFFSAYTWARLYVPSVLDWCVCTFWARKTKKLKEYVWNNYIVHLVVHILHLQIQGIEGWNDDIDFEYEELKEEIEVIENVVVFIYISFGSL